MVNLPNGTQNQGFQSRRLWSLWDMIDFCLRDFMRAMEHLHVARMRVEVRTPTEFPSQADMTLIRQNLHLLGQEAAKLAMPTVLSRFARIEAFFGPGAYSTYGHLLHEVDEIFNAVERDANDDYFCHYPRAKVEVLLRKEDQWEAVFRKFKSAKAEIESGLDCYALGQNTACIFHMSRASEIGLRTIGRSLGVKTVRNNVPIEWGTWGQVLKAIEDELEPIRKKPNGRKKDAALAFYTSALSDLRAILNLYRDPTMHFRGSYNDGEAQGATFRVRSLMTTLASKLDEDSTKRVPWSAWK